QGLDVGRADGGEHVTDVGFGMGDKRHGGLRLDVSANQNQSRWVPACAGMTELEQRCTALLRAVALGNPHMDVRAFANGLATN
ncbi:hypothetical protein, partial [Lysobacter sp. A3-1-A15]|uniref:hypothetical protein n=1 Tax=Novilysobacter viscosus TaxID=3098602 RepID=UPI002ED7CBF2